MTVWILITDYWFVNRAVRFGRTAVPIIIPESPGESKDVGAAHGRDSEGNRGRAKPVTL
jgi:hypothetical protein